MALNSSGPISLGGPDTGQSIQETLYNTANATISLGDPDVRTLAGKPTGPVVMPWDFYGKISPLVVEAYGIGAGGYSPNDTSGGAGGGGAVVKQFTMNSTNPTCTITIGYPSYNSNGGSSTLTNTGITTLIANGGQKNGGPPNPGGSGSRAPGGSASGGDLNLTGGTGGGWNNGSAGDNGASGVLDGVTYYSAGGGGSGNDYGPFDNAGGTGGSYAGNGGTGYLAGNGDSGTNYGGGGGGGGQNGRASGSGAQGAFIITYTSATQRATGGTVSSSGSGAGTIWTHLFTSDGTFTAT